MVFRFVNQIVRRYCSSVKKYETMKYLNVAEKGEFDVILIVQ